MKTDSHEIVLAEFERHLAGNASRAFYEHLAGCEPCDLEVREMTALAELIPAVLRTETAPEPGLGFYSKVATTINQQGSPGWGLFSLSEVFFRRLAFASLMLLAAMGSYLVTQEGGQTEDAAAIFAKHDPSAIHADGQDRDHMLLTLASYQ